MAVKLTIGYLGGASFKRAWGRAALALTDLRPIWGAVQGWFSNEMKQIFESQGKHALQSWPSLGALTDDPPGRYGRWKMRHHPGKPLLYLYGNLKWAAMGRAGQHTYKEVTPERLVLGIAGLPYVKCMNFGFSPNHIPARRFVTPPSAASARVLDKAVQKVCNQINREINRAAAEAAGFAGGMAR